MDEIKRLNYFNSQFLVDKDFKDEQAYHRNLRRLHNQLLHSSGVASTSGLQVTGSARQLSITSGMAIDNQGREIVLPDNAPAIDLTPAGAATNLTVAIAYQEFFNTANTADKQGDNFTRTTERPQIRIYGSSGGQGDITKDPLVFLTGDAPTDGSVVVLAKVALQAGSVSNIDQTVRKSANALIAANAIDTSKIANDAITIDKIADNAVGNTQLAAGAVTSDKLAPAVQSQINAPILSINNVGTDANNRNITLAGANAITITPPPAGSKTITIGENHSALTNNPHQTTATQIDTQGGTNRIVTQINAGAGVINDPRIDPAIARVAAVNARFDPGTGHSHDGTDSRRIAPTSLAGVNATVSAANLNTLTTGATSDASSLHVHNTIPTQTLRYHIPMAPLSLGASPAFTSTLTTITAPANTQAVGRILLSLPNRAQLTQLTISASTAPAGATFNLAVQIQRVPSDGSTITNVTNLIAITSTSTVNPSLNNHAIDNSAGVYWLVLIMQTIPTAAISINQLFIDYTLNRLF